MYVEKKEEKEKKEKYMEQVYVLLYDSCIE